jgi:hypothetical protein
MARPLSPLLVLLVLAACGDRSPAANATASLTERVTMSGPGPDVRGTWYPVATNPNPQYFDKIITDYRRYTFRTDTTVVRVTQTERGTETNEGTYVPHRQVTATFDLGDAGVQSYTWELEALGMARAVDWQNRTTGRRHPEQDRFIQEGSAEWGRRAKVTVNETRPTVAGIPDPASYPADAPERVFLQYLRAWSHHDWATMAALSSQSWLAAEPDPTGEIRARLGSFTPLGARELAVETISPHIVRVRATATLRFGGSTITRRVGIRINREDGRWGVFKNIVQIQD